MKSFRTNLVIFIAIIIVALVSGIFSTPWAFEKLRVNDGLWKIGHTLGSWTGHESWGDNFKINEHWSLGLDLVGGTSLIYDIDLKEVKAADRSDVVAGLKDVIEKRVNLYGVAEPKISIAQKGDTYELIVDLAGVKDLKDAVNQIGATPSLDFREVLQDGQNVSFAKTELTGRYIAGASLTFDNLNKPVVTLQFNNIGAKIFEDITGRNVGKPLAIFMDGQLTDAPRVNEKISGGQATISGGGAGFTIDEAKTLIQRLNAGALSAPITLANQRTVSATSAADALNKVVVAGMIGAGLVMLFMIFYYRVFGIFACVALVVYTALTLAFFKSGLLGLIPSFTMTLSGIAGFILSVGMAVDANILIFERTREELKKGLLRASAIEEGFKRAWLSIRDSNVSTMITAGILYFFTSSFVQGFALTLGIGVLISMFSAIFVTRNMLRLFMR
ncbi:MAG: protein translocase subunit SecD [Patescibacteria group bacterium]